jgi:hypothetical protein
LQPLSESLLTITYLRWPGGLRQGTARHQEVPWEASNFFSRVIEKARLKLMPFDRSRLRREIKETARC